MEKHRFDLSATDKIKSPSKNFEAFLQNYFLEPNIYIRREEDPSTFRMLQGPEKDTAIELIERNLESGHGHLIDAVSMFEIRSAIPKLQAMLASAQSLADQFVISRNLARLEAIDREVAFTMFEQIILSGSNYWASDAYNLSYRLFSISKIADLVAIGFRRDDYMIRCSAYDALMALELICESGGQYTADLGKEIQRRKFYGDPDGVDRFHIYSRVLADDVFENKLEFENQVEELETRLSIVRAKCGNN